MRTTYGHLALILYTYCFVCKSVMALLVSRNSALGDEEGLSCPHGYNWIENSVDGFCYWETSYETKKLSWIEARKYCQSYGGDLSSFHRRLDEQIGLSFQYGSTKHPYWIGLLYDAENDSYSWVDGTPLDYLNWGPFEPNDRFSRFKCVQMDAEKAHWVSAYCGQLSWFVCKAPKRVDPPIPVLPTVEPLSLCSDQYQVYFFEGFCYSMYGGVISRSWHDARKFCENNDAYLVSTLSEKEIDFLIRMLDSRKTSITNLVWIGLNALGVDDQYQWVDGSPLNFVNWVSRRDFADEYRERCVALDVTNGLWQDRNCNVKIEFVCKASNDSKSTTSGSRASPAVENCETGWYTYGDQCYLVKNEHVSWDKANANCRNHKAYLTSIGNYSFQGFLTFLLQDLKSDAWIGLHDRYRDGQFFWIDSSPMTYTNWELGQPSTINKNHDCVYMGYNQTQKSGKWKVSSCQSVHPYICKKRKSRDIETPWVPRIHKCLHPQGWLKQGMSCYMRFNDSDTYELAMKTCALYQARLVAINDLVSEAVVTYLTLGTEKNHWIGLNKTDDNEYRWNNGWPLSFSRWGYAEPTSKNGCFAFNAEGLWTKSACNARWPFICQVSANTRPVEVKYQGGHCPTKDWVDLGDENCYIFETVNKADRHDAELHCFTKGSHLASIHSMEQMEKIRNYLKSKSEAFYIGLTRARNLALAWSDSTPFNFEDWEEGEPQVGYRPACGDILPGSLKWRITSCDTKKAFICGIRKENLTITSGNMEKLISESEGSGLSTVGIALLGILGVVVLIGLAVAAIWSFQPNFMSRFRMNSSQRVLSFENALFSANPSTEIENLNTNTLYVSDDTHPNWSDDS